jgi:hypothetical protein
MYITPLTEAQYNAMNRERSADGLGPFCQSYASYLALCQSHNAAVRRAAQ